MSGGIGLYFALSCLSDTKSLRLKEELNSTKMVGGRLSSERSQLKHYRRLDLAVGVALCARSHPRVLLERTDQTVENGLSLNVQHRMTCAELSGPYAYEKACIFVGNLPKQESRMI